MRFEQRAELGQRHFRPHLEALLRVEAFGRGLYDVRVELEQQRMEHLLRLQPDAAFRPLGECGPRREAAQRGTQAFQVVRHGVRGGERVARALAFPEITDRLVEQQGEAGQHGARFRLGERRFMGEAPAVHELRVVDDERHQSGRRGIAQAEIAAKGGIKPRRAGIARARHVIDQVVDVLAQQEGRGHLRVVGPPERMIRLEARVGARAELAVGDEGGGAQDVADFGQQRRIRLPAGGEALDHVLEQAPAAIAARINQRVVVGVTGALLGHLDAQARLALGRPFALAEHAHRIPALRPVAVELLLLRELERHEKEVKGPAAAHQAIEDLAAAFRVQVEAQLFDLPAAAHQLAHRRAREAERIGHRGAGAARVHDEAGGSKRGRGIRVQR